MSQIQSTTADLAVGCQTKQGKKLKVFCETKEVWLVDAVAALEARCKKHLYSWTSMCSEKPTKRNSNMVTPSATLVSMRLSCRLGRAVRGLVRERPAWGVSGRVAASGVVKAASSCRVGLPRRSSESGSRWLLAGDAQACRGSVQGEGAVEGVAKCLRGPSCVLVGVSNPLWVRFMTILSSFVTPVHANVAGWHKQDCKMCASWMSLATDGSWAADPHGMHRRS